MVSIPATRISTIVPKTCSSGELLAIDLRVQQIRREVVARIGLWSSIWATKYASMGSNCSMRSSSERSTDFGDHVDDVDELVGVLFGKAQHLADD